MVPALWDGRRRTLTSQGAVLCSSLDLEVEFVLDSLLHGIMDARTARPGWLQDWLFSLCLVPSSVASKHNVGIPKIGNTQPMTFTL